MSDFFFNLSFQQTKQRIAHIDYCIRLSRAYYETRDSIFSLKPDESTTRAMTATLGPSDPAAIKFSNRTNI